MCYCTYRKVEAGNGRHAATERTKVLTLDERHRLSISAVILTRTAVRLAEPSPPYSQVRPI